MSTALFDPIKTMSKITDSVIVGFSCGKESTVVLDLCFRYFKRVVPYFLYICPELSFQERALQWYEKKYQTEIIRLPHMDVCEFFHYGSFRPGDLSFPIVGINDIHHYLRVKTDIDWIACGERMDDSLFRRGMIHKSGSIDEDRGRFYPVAMWKKQEILDYIKFHNLYRDEWSRKTGHSYTNLSGKELINMKDHFPDDYKKILHLYPFAEAGVKRFEEYEAKNEGKNGKK